MEWLHRADEDRLFLSVVTLAELRLGVESLAPSGRRRRLEQWLASDLAARFEGRVLPIDPEVADAWGRLVARSRSAGRPMGALDAFLGATAERHRLTLVTRNTADFAAAGLKLLSPWSG